MTTEKRNREIQLKFRVTPQERALIDKRMEQAGTVNMAAFLRKMSIDGYVLRLDLPELKEMVSLLRRCSNNLNQIAKRANEAGIIYDAALVHVQMDLEQLWDAARGILAALAEID